MITLSKRLSKCAEYVRSSAKFADIGTDHGYLPIYLLLSGKVTSAIAADIGEKPLASAKMNAARYSAELKLVLSNGFESLESQDITDACLAGMGGELMVKILSSAAFLKGKPSSDFEKYRLILQPQSHENDLRKYLSDNGWEILREEAVLDDKKIYTVICAEPSGNYELSKVELFIGKLDPTDENSRIYAEKQVKQLKNKLKGIEPTDPQFTELTGIIQEIEEKYLKI